MRLPVMAAGVLLLASTAPERTAAMEWLSADELEQSCDAFLNSSEDTAGAPCLAYMQGFLAGADTASISSSDRPTSASNSETFTERASRTRLGTLRMLQIRAGGNGDYCIAGDIAAVDIIRSVATYINEHPETLNLSNADAVREALIHHYPCEG